MTSRRNLSLCSVASRPRHPTRRAFGQISATPFAGDKGSRKVSQHCLQAASGIGGYLSRCLGTPTNACPLVIQPLTHLQSVECHFDIMQAKAWLPIGPYIRQCPHPRECGGNNRRWRQLTPFQNITPLSHCTAPPAVLSTGSPDFLVSGHIRLQCSVRT